MANLPSNTPGDLSSEMYSVITDLVDGRSMLVGQEPPFNQFFYIRLIVRRHGGGSFFELTYDFGRQMIEPGESLALDGIVFLFGSRPEVEQSYFQGIGERIRYKPPLRNHRGWSSWYQYHNKIDPDVLYRNLNAIRSRKLGFDFFLVDDGWQAAVGDWLEQSPAFKGRMREIADKVRSAGMRPGLWFAPFTAARNSELFRLHPEYLLKDEYGKLLKAGYNPTWKCFYYGLNITHPRFAEYLREIIRTIVKDWGFEYLKCDFLFSACLRGAAHHELRLSRSMVLKSGMRLIRQVAGEDVVILGCGMPLSAGIGLVDTMRVGPDTGNFWIKLSGKLLRTGAMVGTRNSLRNFMVRSPMHKRLWLNDPDCVMVRDTDTRLTPAERTTQLDAIAVSGGLLTYSDDFTALPERSFRDLALIDSVSKECFQGRAIAIDVMNGEMPEIFFNTAGYVVFFNFRAGANRHFDISALRRYNRGSRYWWMSEQANGSPGRRRSRSRTNAAAWLAAFQDREWVTRCRADFAVRNIPDAFYSLLKLLIPHYALENRLLIWRYFSLCLKSPARHNADPSSIGHRRNRHAVIGFRENIAADNAESGACRNIVDKVVL